MRIFKFMPAAFAAMAMLLTACGDDPEPVTADNNGNTGTGSNGESYTTEQTKERIASIAEQFMSKFNPEDQKNLVQFLDYMAETYGDYSIEDDDYWYAPMRHIGRSTEIIDLVNDVPAGIYTPDGDGEWVKTGNSTDVVFRIPNDARYGNIDLTVKREGGKNELNVTTPDEDSYHLVIPSKVTAILTARGTTMLTDVLEANLNLANHTLTATENLTAANIKVTANVNANNTQATVTSTFSVGGEQLISATGNVNGRNLCDPDAIAEAVEYNAFERLFNSAKTNGNVMNSLFLSGTANITKQVIEAYDGWFDFGPDREYSSETEASLACDRAITLLNRNIICDLSFTNGGASQAKLVMIKDGRSYWNNYWNERSGFYRTQLAIEFLDGTTYTTATDDIFEYGFDSVFDRFDALINAYKNICR